MGHVTEMVRNCAYNKDMEKHAVARKYNKLLQDEKDAHLQTRLESDAWHAKFMDAVAKIRHAYRLRVDEADLPIMVVSGLQNEVRGLRSCLGWEPEKFEDEFGYPILRDVPGGDGKEETSGGSGSGSGGAAEQA